MNLPAHPDTALRPLLTVIALLALLPAIAALSAVIALIGLGRFSADLDPAAVVAWFWYYRDDPSVRRWLMTGATMATAMVLALLIAALLTRRRPLHGAARWATAAEIARAGLRSREGVILGRTRSGGLMTAGGPGHVMVCAPTRSGKGVGVVIPTLLGWPGPVVVLDMKQENHAATAGYRAEAGEQVVLFDPLAPDGRTARYNPLGHIDRSSPARILDELQRIAVMLFTPHPGSDPFWSDAARTAFIGVGALVAETPELPFTFGEILRQLTRGDPRARLSTVQRSRRDTGRPLSPGCTAALGDFCAAGETTFASIRQTVTSRLGLWLNPAVDAATSASDFDLRTLRSGRLSLYLGATPDNLPRVAPLYALLFQQLVDLSSRSLPAPGDRTVLVVLDEFARLGAAPVLAQAFSWIAAYGLRLLPVIQSPAQLRHIYGPDATEEILTNCGIEVALAPKDLAVARELSERLGFQTVRSRSRNRPSGLHPGRSSITTSDQRRPLMLPQELMQLPADALLVLKAGTPPVRGRRIVYYRERVFRSRLRPPPPYPVPGTASPVGATGHGGPARQGEEERDGPGLPPSSAIGEATEGAADAGDMQRWLERLARTRDSTPGDRNGRDGERRPGPT